MIKPSLQTYRLSNLKLALDHNSGALRAKIILLLEISNEELVNLHVYLRGYDARNKSNIHFIYTLDLTFSESVDIDKLLNKFYLNYKKTGDGTHQRLSDPSNPKNWSATDYSKNIKLKFIETPDYKKYMNELKKIKKHINKI